MTKEVANRIENIAALSPNEYTPLVSLIIYSQFSKKAIYIFLI